MLVAMAASTALQTLDTALNFDKKRVNFSKIHFYTRVVTLEPKLDKFNSKARRLKNQI